jgi:hypothetical protein
MYTCVQKEQSYFLSLTDGINHKMASKHHPITIYKDKCNYRTFYNYKRQHVYVCLFVFLFVSAEENIMEKVEMT